MRRLLTFLCVIVIACQNAYCMSIARGLDSSGLLGPNAHSHVATGPAGILVYTLDVRATAAGGFVQLVKTIPKVHSETTYGPNGVGAGWIDGQESNVLADVITQTANESVHIEYEAGLKCGDNLLVDCNNAYAIVGYKQ